jgi:CheY-like chemotaxis protein
MRAETLPEYFDRIHQAPNAPLTTDHSPLSTHSSIRVLLVDDHAIVRQGLRSVLDSYANIKLVGEAANGEEAVALTEKLRPAVVVMDINMPKMNGVEVTAQIKGPVAGDHRHRHLGQHGR